MQQTSILGLCLATTAVCQATGFCGCAQTMGHRTTQPRSPWQRQGPQPSGGTTVSTSQDNRLVPEIQLP